MKPWFTGRPGGGAHRQQQYHPLMQRQGVQDDSTNDGVIMVSLTDNFMHYRCLFLPIVMSISSIQSGHKGPNMYHDDGELLANCSL